MEEPPLKRQRRTDSNAMWDRSELLKSNGTARGSEHAERERTRKEPTREPSGKNDRSSRSRSRERMEGKRTMGREVDRDRGPRDDRDRHKSRKQDSRTERPRSRSRSPARTGVQRRNGVRDRSPPRPPQSGRSRERPRHDGERPSHRPRDSKATTGSNASQNSIRSGDVNGKMDMEAAPLNSDEELESQMLKLMGFGKFRSTKNTKVPGNDKLYGVRKEKKAEYRQYMNRVGGFNRPLSPSR